MSNPQTRAARLGISEEAMEMLAHLTDIEIRTQTCDDCKNVMTVHPGGAWRFRPHPIRCDLCATMQRERGATAFEARFVS